MRRFCLHYYWLVGRWRCVALLAFYTPILFVVVSFSHAKLVHLLSKSFTASLEYILCSLEFTGVALFENGLGNEYKRRFYAIFLVPSMILFDTRVLGIENWAL